VPHQDVAGNGHWQYRGGKAGFGAWKWLDDNISDQLEQAWGSGQHIIVLANQYGSHDTYNLMTLKARLTGMEKSHAGERSIRRWTPSLQQ
jgi:hypothetical protein